MTSLTKDLMSHIDKQFITDPHKYSPLADLCIHIYSKLRNAISPILIYKSEIWKFLHPADTLKVKQIHTKSKPQEKSHQEEKALLEKGQNKKVESIPSVSKQLTKNEVKQKE